MQAKLKSASKFTRFMLAHGEKLGMAAVVAVAGLLIWSSLGREQLEADKAPDKLQQAAATATSHVQEMNWEEFPEDARTVADDVIVSVNPDAPVVNPDDPWNIDEIDPPATSPASKRKDPELLSVEKVEVSTGSGIWASADPRVLRERRLKAIKEAQKEAQDAEREAEEEAKRMANGDGGRGGRGGRGRGGYGGGFGGDGSTTKDGALVVRPTGGAPLLGDEDLQNHSWVIVKAKVPIRSQVRTYEDALAMARGYAPTTDVPQYMGYQVQRVEVTETGDGEWVNLINVIPRTLMDQMETWPIQTPDEFVDPKYNHPLLTFPLPPMVLRSWDSSVTHSDLPLPSPEEMFGSDDGRRRGRDGRGRDGGDGDEGGKNGDDLFEEATQRPTGPGGFGGGMGEFGGRGGGFDGGRMGQGGRGGFDGGYGGRGGFDGGYGGRGGDGGYGGRGFSTEMMGRGEGGYDASQFEGKAWDGQTRYWLFRFFDSKVEPGKRYKYRVRLAMQDVNADVQEMYLENEVIERRTTENKKYRLTPWSEPSPVAVVPHAGLVFVAGAKAANPANFNDEPEAEMLIKSLDKGSSAEVALADYFTRGTVLNLIGQQAKIIWSSTFEAVDDDGMPVASPEFDFRTGLTLLDFEGGETLNGNRDLTAPARAMVMDAAGRLWIKAELDDEKPVVEYDAYMEAAAEQMRQNAQRGDDGGRGGRGGGDRGGRGGGGRGGGY